MAVEIQQCEQNYTKDDGQKNGAGDHCALDDDNGVDYSPDNSANEDRDSYAGDDVDPPVEVALLRDEILIRILRLLDQRLHNLFKLQPAGATKLLFG